MTKITPISPEVRTEILKRASVAAEDFLQSSKNNNFNIREYAKKGVYYLASAKLEGTVLGAKGASLKLLVHKYKNKSIFAIFKNGKVLGARGYFAYKGSVMPILDKLCEKGKIKDDEVKFAQKQLGWA